MGKVMAGMTMSLDGFINDSNGSSEKLSPDFSELLEAPSFKEMTKTALYGYLKRRKSGE